MSYLDQLIKLAARFELKLKKAESESKELLEAAMDANKNHGMQIYFHGQHFGWYKWDPKKKKHEQFSIADFSPKDTIGELEEDVGNLTKVNLEDYEPVVAGRKQV